MSASLVGSEMCIRDRPFSAETAAPWPCPRGRGMHTESSGKARNPSRCSCLLYTSDAADDM
eukprot:9433576-Alexandrium_andersonii.AAC.1